MAQDWAKPFYNSQAWIDCRYAYAKSVFNLCEDCRAQGIIEPGVIVHHKIPLTPDNITDPMITLSFQNLELLCASCHGNKHRKYKEVVRNGLKFDNFGQLVPDQTSN